MEDSIYVDIGEPGADDKPPQVEIHHILDDVERLPVSLDMEYVLDSAPAHAVLQAASPKRHDLVVLGARGSSVSGQALLGRVAARVLQASPVPVLVTRRLNASQKVSKTVMALLG